MNENEIVLFCGFNKTTKYLCELYSMDDTHDNALYEWLDAADFEALPSEATSMAAVMGAASDYSGIPPRLIPRLKGINRYIHTLNSGMLSGLCALGARLNQSDISVLLLDETALYVRFNNAPQRQLWQMFIAVSEKDYEDTLNIARDIGFSVEKFPQTAVARQGVTRQIIIAPLKEKDFHLVDAEKIEMGGADFLCPTVSEILIGLSRRNFRALTKPNPSLVRWFMDMKLLLGLISDKDWACALKIAKREHSCHLIGFLLTVYAAITGDIIPQASSFASGRASQKVFALLKKLQKSSEKGWRMRRSFLLFRLRRPDNIFAATALFGKNILNKIDF